MKGTKLGATAYLYHKSEVDWHPFNKCVLADWNPKTIELDEHRFNDDYLIETFYARMTGRIILRNVDLSNSSGDMHADPERLADIHAEYWKNKVNHLKTIKNFRLEDTLVNGVNEPSVGTEKEMENTARYYTRFLDNLTALGIRGGALRFSVGWPNNTGKDTPADWSPFEAVHEAIKRGNHVLFVNEYWGKTGPWDETWYGWHTDRLGQCPWNVPIVVTECGLDQHVLDAPTNEGWQLHVSKEQYWEMLKWYDWNVLRSDPRVLGGNIFTYDFGHPWWHFDVRPLREEIRAYAIEQREVSNPVQKEVPRYPKNVVIPENPPVSFQPDYPYAAVFPSPNFNDRPGGEVSAVVLHHTGGSYDSSLNWLRSPDSGVSTHYLIAKDGRVAQLVQESKRAWHAGPSEWLGIPDLNNRSIGIELENAGTGDDPYPHAQLRQLYLLLKYLVKKYNIKRDWITTHQAIDTRRKKRDPRGLKTDVLLDLVYLGIEFDATKPPWATEEATRILEREGLKNEARVMKEVLLPYLFNVRGY